jgi:hypothetical protein
VTTIQFLKALEHGGLIVITKKTVWGKSIFRFGVRQFIAAFMTGIDSRPIQSGDESPHSIQNSFSIMRRPLFLSYRVS